MTLIHDPGDTILYSSINQEFHEASNQDESLTINCVEAPTATPTRPPPALGGIATYPDQGRNGANALAVAIAAAIAGTALSAAGCFAGRRRWR